MYVWDSDLYDIYIWDSYLNDFYSRDRDIKGHSHLGIFTFVIYILKYYSSSNSISPTDDAYLLVHKYAIHLLTLSFSLAPSVDGPCAHSSCHDTLSSSCTGSCRGH